jgi:hypothetical protein
MAAKARVLLEFAEQRAEQAADGVELHNALFGIGGKATEWLATESERTAFSGTAECKRIFALLDKLPSSAVKEFGELLATANGASSVRLPRSVHAALLAEARAEGVSLNQLCLSKLVAQLRSVVQRRRPSCCGLTCPPARRCGIGLQVGVTLGKELRPLCGSVHFRPGERAGRSARHRRGRRPPVRGAAQALPPPLPRHHARGDPESVRLKGTTR